MIEFVRYLLSLIGLMSVAYTISSILLTHWHIIEYRLAFIIQFFVTIYLGVFSFIAENSEFIHGGKFMLIMTFVSAFLTGIYMICAIGETKK